jgi:hypothetical protein
MPYLRGAFVMFMPVLGFSTPNVVVFQYNPETLTHAWTQAQTPSAESASPLAVKAMPSETFSFELALDANESIADGGVAGVLAQVVGLGPRLAALELLQYPTGVDALGGLVSTVSASLGFGALSFGGGGDKGKRPVPLIRLPIVIFVWGPGRIAPIRVTGLTITERLYDGRLNPTQARAQVSIRVLTRNEVAHLDGTAKTVANAALTYSESLRQASAVANLGNSAESIIGMLPV